MRLLDFWFEFGSTYSYPAAMRIEALAKSEGIAIAWRPFLLGPIFHDQGWDDSPFNIYPAKGRYMWRDLERVCAQQGLPVRRPSQFPRNGLLAARLAFRFPSEPWLPEFVRRVYVANFAEDRDIADSQVLESVLQALAQPVALLAEAQSVEAKAGLRSQTERAVSMGIFGAPSFTVGGELFWGNDRLEAALSYAKSEAAKYAV
ncbi:MAG TPA: 2-hydroxychromene-2-carboxylate isomerase [Polyangiales bacterium]|nr:2-hydroxychromene-2-carboxylate isomerase [Polyangiales bacterium]